jgi:hypothetical protein
MISKAFFCPNPHWAYVHGRPCTCRHNVDRIFSNQNGFISASFIKDDMMDVVAMTEPNDVKGIPGPEELAPPAQRLLDDKRASYHYQLHIDRLATLMRMLSRVKLHEPTWSRQNFHYGTLEESATPTR